MLRMLHARERRKMPTEFLCGNLNGRDLLEGLGISGRIVLELMLKKGVMLWTGFIRFETGVSGGPLWKR